MRCGRSVCLESTQVGRGRARRAAALAGVEVLVQPARTHAPQPSLLPAALPPALGAHLRVGEGEQASKGHPPTLIAWARLLQGLAECHLVMGHQPHPLTSPSLPSGRDHAHCSRPVFVSASPAGMAAHEGGVCAVPWWTQVPGTMPASRRQVLVLLVSLVETTVCSTEPGPAPRGV